MSESTPELNYIFDVEFNINLPLVKGKLAFHNNDNRFLFMSNDSDVSLSGFVDSIDEDGMVSFRIGDDCLIMIESTVGHVSLNVWLRLNLNKVDFEIYPA
ncbi:MAG: hypothetical protein V4732_11360 [Pseudomonadota bacterium]